MNTTLLAILAGILAATLLYWLLYPRWLNRWGTTPAELSRSLPGDAAVPRPRLQYTQAVTIAAPPDAVWPWLVQMGDGRGGLYSYDWLENLVGCNMHSANRIVPEWQELKVGDMIKIMPAGGPRVERLEPGGLMLLSAFSDGKLQDYDPAGPKPAAYIDQTWVFALEPGGPGETRLITRFRLDYAPASVLNWLMWILFTAHASVVMQRKMLLGIKVRAERIH